MMLEPFASRGEAVYFSGSWSLQPVQLFQLETGETVFRIGWTTFWFDKTGRYQGTDCRYRENSLGSPYPDELKLLQDAVKEHRWQLPDTPYFERGTDEYISERQSSTGKKDEEVDTTTSLH